MADLGDLSCGVWIFAGAKEELHVSLMSEETSSSSDNVLGD